MGQAEIGRIIGSDPLAPFVAQEVADAQVSKAMDDARRVLASSRDAALELTSQAEVVERVYVKQFLPDVAEASRLATALVSGHLDSVPFDPQSLGEHGDSPESVQAYLSAFEAQDPMAEYPFPQLSFPATAIMTHVEDGLGYWGEPREYTISQFSGGRPLAGYSFSPNFRPDIILPTLLDPTMRTLDELADIEPGHGAQLREAYKMAVEAQGDNAVSFQQPNVVRMVAVLPVGPDYATDFVPRIGIPKDTGEAWNPYMLVRGALNDANDYLHHSGFTRKTTVTLNKEGRESSLRVRRPSVGSFAEQADGIMPVAPHEMHSIGVMLFPYEMEERPPVRAIYRGGIDSGSKQTMAVGGVGGAEVGAGQSGFASAEKHAATVWGETFKPAEGGRPVVYSVRLLTATR